MSKLSLDDDELQLGSSSSDVGNVFLPLLQRCTYKNNNNKRKIRVDDPVEIKNGDSADLGVSRGLKSTKKAVDSGEFELLLIMFLLVIDSGF